MPVKRKLNKKVTKVPRNVKINSKRSKRASQKKRGRSGRGRKSQRGGTNSESNFVTEFQTINVPVDTLANFLTDVTNENVWTKISDEPNTPKYTQGISNYGNDDTSKILSFLFTPTWNNGIKFGRRPGEDRTAMTPQDFKCKYLGEKLQKRAFRMPLNERKEYINKILTRLIEGKHEKKDKGNPIPISCETEVR